MTERPTDWVQMTRGWNIHCGPKRVAVRLSTAVTSGSAVITFKWWRNVSGPCGPLYSARAATWGVFLPAVLSTSGPLPKTVRVLAETAIRAAKGGSDDAEQKIWMLLLWLRMRGLAVTWLWAAPSVSLLRGSQLRYQLHQPLACFISLSIGVYGSSLRYNHTEWTQKEHGNG